MTDSPWRAISGSATPRASTRLRMISIVSDRASSLDLLGGLEHHRDAALEVEAQLGRRVRWRAPRRHGDDRDEDDEQEGGELLLRRMRGATLPVGRDAAANAAPSRVPASMAARASSISRRVHHTLWRVSSRGAVGSSTTRRWRR